MRRAKQRAYIIPMSTYWRNKTALDAYVGVQTTEGISYGGNQRWFAKNKATSTLADYGCGLVALGDFFLMAARKYPAAVRQPPFAQAVYLRYLHAFGRKYLTIFPYIGSNAWQIWRAAYRCAKNHGLPFRIHWGTSLRKMPLQMASMLREGLPVPFCVGPNLNPFLPRQKVSLYQLQDDRLQKTGAVRAHYMNLTGLYQDGQKNLYLQVSSWGKCYYISWKEYTAYRRRQPPLLGSWLSNILVVHTGETPI